MTPERLNQIERHFKNPPSSSCNAEWALELVAELRRMSAPLSIEEAVERILPAPIVSTFKEVFAEQTAAIVAEATRPTPPVIDDRPTPPEAPKAKKGKK